MQLAFREFWQNKELFLRREGSRWGAKSGPGPGIHCPVATPSWRRARGACGAVRRSALSERCGRGGNSPEWFDRRGELTTGFAPGSTGFSSTSFGAEPDTRLVVSPSVLTKAASVSSPRKTIARTSPCGFCRRCRSPIRLNPSNPRPGRAASIIEHLRGPGRRPGRRLQRGAGRAPRHFELHLTSTSGTCAALRAPAISFFPYAAGPDTTVDIAAATEKDSAPGRDVMSSAMMGLPEGFTDESACRGDAGAGAALISA